MIMNIIELTNINKFYIKSKSPLKKLSGALFGTVKLKPGELYPALRNLNLTVKRGECVGVIGKNGSGKSTLLKIIAGISETDGGVVKINGSVSAMLELGVGFNPEYSGIQNVFLSGAINGIPKSRIKQSVTEILEFAEIPREFWDLPVKTYSSGMLMRLGFASMIWQDADVILVDEALAVGDIRFQSKCFRRFEALKNMGKTILFVSHDIDAVRRFCSRAVWLSNGEIAADGAVAEITSKYMEMCVRSDVGSDRSFRYINHYGSHIGSIKNVVAGSGYDLNEKIEIRIELDVPVDIDLSSAGVSVAVKDKYGLDLCVFQTEKPLTYGRNIVIFRFENHMSRGEYTVAAGFENKAVTPISYYEYIDGVCIIKSTADPKIFGLVSIPCEIIVG